MDSMNVNKVVAAVLVAGIAFMVTGFIADSAVVSENPAKPAIKIEVAQATTTAAAPTGPAPILALLADADIKAGQNEVTTVCSACHTFNKGGHTLVGPNLYGVVGRKQIEPGFDYSAPFKAKMTGTWTYQALNTWLYAPMKDVPGTRMAFAGIPNNKLRAGVIAYLRTLSDSPIPLPTAAEIAASEPKAAPAKTETAQAAPAAGAAAAPAKEASAGGESAFDKLVADADPKKGAATVNGVCSACHTTNKGGHTLVGPNLWDVVGRKQGAEPGFDYSSAFKAKMKGTWTYDALNTWLTAPMKEVPGTRMAFAGISSEKQRAEVVAYLRTLSDKPVPLPAK